MFDLLMIVLFGCLFLRSIGLMFQIAWCAAKVAAVVLLVLAFPVLAGCLLLAGGFLLLVPIGMALITVGLLRSCT